ncbi:MAG TPA: 3-deoxy-8-phosphooctulonate synthase [Nitrospirota bacterium]
MTHTVSIKNIKIGGGNKIALIAGPCVIESYDKVMLAAEQITEAAGKIGAPLIFKASFDKANRSSVKSFRGPGLSEGLRILGLIKEKFGVPVITDIHSIEQIGPAAEVVDAIQIPAFLCRQTDLLVAASNCGIPVNVKKGQFMSPWDMSNVIDKFTANGSKDLILTERGASFGYNNLVVDFRSLAVMRETGYPVVFDATHSVQLPGGAGTASSGQRQFVAPLARAAAAVGIDGVFMEVHPCPDEALCDGPNMVDIAGMSGIYQSMAEIKDALEGDNA